MLNDYNKDQIERNRKRNRFVRKVKNKILGKKGKN